MKKSLVVVLTALLVISCSKVSVTPKKAIKNVGETYVLSVEGGVPSEFFTENPFVASVDNQGVVTAKHIGETTIGAVVRDEKYGSAVQVKPQISAFTEPLHDWTRTLADVKKAFGTPAFSQEADGDGVLVYMDLTAKSLSVYMFANDKLYGSVMVFFAKYDREKMKQQLMEYYELLEEGEDVETESYQAMFADGYTEGEYATLCPVSTYVILGEGKTDDMGIEGMEGMEQFWQLMGGSNKACAVIFMSADVEMEM